MAYQTLHYTNEVYYEFEVTYHHSSHVDDRMEEGAIGLHLMTTISVIFYIKANITTSKPFIFLHTSATAQKLRLAEHRLFCGLLARLTARGPSDCLRHVF